MSEAPDEFDDGWDMRAALVEGRWVDRAARRPEVEPQVRREVALLPWLAPLLPLAVPVPVVRSEHPLTVRHDYIPGGPCPGVSPEQGTAVGRFLRALHSADPEEAVEHGVRTAIASHEAAQEIRDGLARDVLPRLPGHLRPTAEALLQRMSVVPSDPRLSHSDLGLHHIRVQDGVVTGVIDWGDCGIGDPAIDLAATVIGCSGPFADALTTAYGADSALLDRARDFHQLGPWHEVSYGLLIDDPAYVESGLAGTIDRLGRFGRT